MKNERTDNHENYDHDNRPLSVEELYGYLLNLNAALASVSAFVYETDRALKATYDRLKDEKKIVGRDVSILSDACKKLNDDVTLLIPNLFWIIGLLRVLSISEVTFGNTKPPIGSDPSVN